MKEFIRQRLTENLVGKTMVAYHGTPQPIKKFADTFVGGKNATDQEGPGIYFTTKLDEAIKYAGETGYIYKVDLTVRKLVSDKSSFDLSSLEGPITKLVKMSPNWKRVARGYDDDVEEGLYEMVSRYVGMSQSQKEAFIAVYNDVYKNDPVSFVRNMVKLGYDGLFLPARDEGGHIVIYNPKSINIVDTKKVG